MSDADAGEVQESFSGGPPVGGKKSPNFNSSGGEGGETTAPGYKEFLKTYAARYGYSIRAVKGWIAAGRECSPPRLPPLDEPEEMPHWWTEVKSNRASDRLIAVAEEARKARLAAEAPSDIPPPPDLATPAPQGSAATPNPAMSTGTELQTLAIGFAASLDRIRMAEAKANLRYLQELEKPDETRDESKVNRYRRDWSELGEQLRHMEKQAPDVLRKSGEMMTRAEVRRLLGELHAPIVSGFRKLLKRVRSLAPATASLDSIEKLYEEGCEALLGRLVASKFTADE